jgi:hypothetical protein
MDNKPRSTWGGMNLSAAQYEAMLQAVAEFAPLAEYLRAKNEEARQEMEHPTWPSWKDDTRYTGLERRRK